MSASPDDDQPAPAADRRTGRGSALLHTLMRAAGLGLLQREAKAAARNAGIRALLTVAAFVLWLLVLGFLLGAFVVWLASQVGAIPACAIVAAFFAIIALALQVISARLARRKHRWHLDGQFAGITEAVGAGNLDEKTLRALIVAALAGFFVGFRSNH